MLAKEQISMATPIQPDWIEHSQTLLSASIIVIGTLLSAIGLLLAYVVHGNTATLNNFRDDMKELFGRMRKNEKEIAYLKGAHETRTGMKISCSETNDSSAP